RLMRATYFMQHGTEGLDKLKNLKHFDADVSFAQFPSNVQSELERLFPNKANPNYEYDPDVKSALDVFKNFAYPLRDWSEHLDALGVRSLAQKVQEAQDAYKAKLSQIIRQLRARQIDD